jgi:hypothetical protein
MLLVISVILIQGFKLPFYWNVIAVVVYFLGKAITFKPVNEE